METFLSPQDTSMAGRSRNAGGRYNMETSATKQYSSIDISLSMLTPHQQKCFLEDLFILCDIKGANPNVFGSVDHPAILA